jgi:hypothetical protein
MEPIRPNTLRGRLQISRDDGTWNAYPILFLVAIILAATYFAYASLSSTGTNRPIRGAEAPTITIPPATVNPEN